jgi:hypothetical protein
MKALLINPYEKKIQEVVIAPLIMDVKLILEFMSFDVIDYGVDHKIFTNYIGCDGSKDRRYFKFQGVVYGDKALIVNRKYVETSQGHDVTVSIEDVERHIEFMPDTHKEIKQFDFNI